QDTEDSVVDLPLTRRELPVHRNGAGQIRIVIGVTGSDVHEQHIAITANVTVFDVMKNAGVFSRSNNRIVGKLAAASQELVGKFGFDFVFVDTGADKAADAAEAGFGGGAG